jgi:hypothetical protein
MLLRIRPARNRGENSLGYLMRLGQAHGMRRTSEIARYVGLSSSNVTRTESLGPLAERAGIDFQALRFDSPEASPGKVALGGQILRPRQLSVKTGRRACSECLRSDLSHSSGNRLPRSWHRNWWDVQAVSVCPIHGSRLLLACGHCGIRLDFVGTQIGCCPNGHPISSGGPPVVGPFAGDSYIVGRLGGSRTLKHALLDAGSLGSAIDALEIVGAATVSIENPSSHAQKHDVLNAGFRALSDWPRSFDRLLEEVSGKSNMGVGRWGAAAAYGPLHARLMDMPEDPISLAIRDRVRRHAAENGISGSKPVFGKVTEDRAFLSVSEAARTLGAGFETTRALLNSRGLITANTRRGTPINVPVEAVKRLASTNMGVLTFSGFSKRLGIGRSQARSILRSGVFGEWQRKEKFAAAMIDSLLNTFNGSGRPLATDAVSLPDACRIGKCPIEKALQAILERQLEVKHLDRKLQGLRQVQVLIQDVRKFGKLCRTDISFSDAANVLKVKWETVGQLARMKYLRGGRTSIRRDSLSKFKRVYVRGSEIAMEIGVRPQTFLKLARDVRLRPIIGPPFCRQVFFRRTEVSRTRPMLTIAAARRRQATKT